MKNEKMYLYKGMFTDRELKDFLYEDYSDENEESCELWKDLNVEFLDNQFLEVIKTNDQIEYVDVNGISYSEQFQSKLMEIDLSNANTIIAVYQPEESLSENPIKLNFLRSFDYNID